MTNNASTSDPLLPAIEQALDLYGISATRFGYFACGDPAIVGKMRNGMQLRPRRRSAVEAALARIEKDGGIR